MARKRKVVLTRWSPKCLDAADIVEIISAYGYNNDSMFSEKYDSNIQQWRITLKVERIDDES